jgi:prepilin-type N-terminal cleavage/methylation domain-containing protein/prepilin-type processing-associated H-X9-DG protein
MVQVKQGFTLIELLVVIAIIAIIAALLFPVFAQAKAAAGDARTISNLKQLGTAFELYTDDYDDVYPQCTDGQPGEGLLGGWIYYSIYRSTDAGTFDVTKGTVYPYVTAKPVYLSSGDPEANWDGNSFAMNGYLTTWQPTGLSPSKAATAVPFPAGTMLLGEEGSGTGSLFGYGYNNGTNDGYFNPVFDHFSKFHPGGAAVVFCDSHAKIFQAQDHYVQTVCGSPVQCF